MTRGSHWVVAGAALGTVLLAGCDSSGGDQPSPSPTPSASSVSPSASSSPSPSLSPSASGSEIPAAAREQTPAGAEAYVEYFFDQFNVAWTKPQPGLIKSMGTSGCEFCANSEDTTQKLADKKQKYAEDPVRLNEAQSFGGAPEGEQYVRIKFTQSGARVVDSSGKEVARDKKLTADANAALRWVDQRWLVRGIERG